MLTATQVGEHWPFCCLQKRIELVDQPFVISSENCSSSCVCTGNWDLYWFQIKSSQFHCAIDHVGIKSSRISQCFSLIDSFATFLCFLMNSGALCRDGGVHIAHCRQLSPGSDSSITHQLQSQHTGFFSCPGLHIHLFTFAVVGGRCFTAVMPWCTSSAQESCL
jgi:hypothetical protein